MKIQNLNDLFVEQLYDMYYSENKLTKALPKMAEKATDERLSKAFTDHLQETQGHVEILERVMASLDIPVKSEKCEAIEGLVKEAEEIMQNTKDEETINAALILAGQKVEHYEIATYGCLCAFAKRLGYKEEAEMLHQILDQEKNADQTLTRLAEGRGGLNKKAAA